MDWQKGDDPLDDELADSERSIDDRRQLRKQRSGPAERKYRDLGIKPWYGVFALVPVAAAGLWLVAQRPSRHSASTVSLPQVRAATANALDKLPPPNLLKPVTPKEALEENAGRPFVERSDSAAARFVLKSDKGSLDRAVNCLTQAVYYEAAGEGPDGERAVAQVVLNRMRHPGYPASVCGVIYQGSDRSSGCQFTFTCDGSLLRTPIAALWARSRKIAQEALAGRVFAAVGHATHYHADYVLPYWADSLDKSVQVGRHIFYRLKGSLGDSRAFMQRYVGVEPQLPQPPAAVIIPPAAVTEQLANALIDNGLSAPPKDVEKANTPAASPLAIDAVKGSLLTDTKDPAVSTTRTKSTTVDCAASSERKQLSPLRADDIRASSSPTGC